MNRSILYYKFLYSITFFLLFSANSFAQGNALRFDGSNDYVAVAPKSEVVAGSYTVMAWVKPEHATKAMHILSTRESGEFGFDMQLVGGNKVHADIGNGSSFYTTSADANYKYVTNRWIHVAYTVSPTAYKIYVNGNLINSGVLNTTPLLLDADHYITIGKNATENTFFQGSIDKVKIYKTELTQADIKTDMLSTTAAVPASLVAYYNFDQSGTVLTDQSGNGYDGVVTNFALSGANSNWVESYAMVIPQPLATTAISSSGFTANWLAPTVGTIDEYELEVAKDNAFTNQIAGSPFTVNGTNQTITGLLSGTDYYYRISANKSSVDGQGAYSSTEKVTTSAAFDYLSSFSMNGVALLSPFSSSQLTYSAITANSTVQLLAHQSNSTSVIEFQINSSGFTSLNSGALSSEIPLNVGNNTVEVKVTDGLSSRTYTFSINRITPTMRYVTQSGTGAKDGSSWLNASDDLQLMINNSAAYDEVWVAQGLYHPVRNSDDVNQIILKNRLNAFVLKTDVKIYGGFAGTETSVEERDLSQYKSILSGDFNDDDSITGSMSTLTINNQEENAYHVVISEGSVGLALLDGFTIKGGNANGNIRWIGSELRDDGYGGGLLLLKSSPRLSNLRVEANFAYLGGGMAAEESQSVLENITISSNKAKAGGGIENISSTLSLNNIIISNNRATANGGGMLNLESAPTITNAKFFGNHSLNNGGAIYNTDASPILVNVSITGNIGNDYGGGISNRNNSSPQLTNVLIAGNIAHLGAGILNAETSSSTLTNVTITGNRAATNTGGIENYGASTSIIRNSIIWGNTSPINKVIRNGSNPAVVNYSLVEGGYAGTGNIDADPQFRDNANNNYGLKGSSLAIDAGSSIYYTLGQTPDISAIKTDLKGNKRNIGANIDMGAYEAYITSAALNFDGVDDKVTFGPTAISVTNNFTVQAWVRPTDASKTMHILSTKAVGGYGFEIQLSGGNTIHANIGTDNAWLSNAANVTYDYSAGRWMHIAYSVSSTGYQIYINGTLKGSGTFSGTPLLLDANHILQLGYNSTDDTFFKGDIDELRIYSKALSETEINTEMMNTIPSPLNLIAYYNFDQGAPQANNTSLTILEDQGENGYHGTLGGFTLNGGNSNWVESYAMVMPDVAIPISLSSSSFEAKWAFPQMGTVDNGYSLEVSTDAAFTTPIAGSPFAVSGTAKTIIGLQPNAVYYYRAAADKLSVTGTGAYTKTMVTNTTVYTPPGNALNFDGDDDYVKIKPQATVVSGSFTVMAWVKPTNATKAMHILSTREGGDNTFDMQLTGGNKIHGDIGKGTSWMENSADANYNYKINQWLHVAYVVTPTAYRIYANGVDVGGGTLSAPAVFLDATHYITIGENNNEETFFKGSIDEVKIYSAALSVTDIKQDMLNNSIANPAALVAYYNFDQATNSQSNVLTDQGSNGYHGTLYGFALSGNTSNWVESYAMAVPTATAATTITFTSFNANWTAPVNGTVDNGYILDVATDANFASPITGSPFTVNALTKEITGLNGNETYYYRVRADKTSLTGQGAHSAIINVLTTEPVLPVVLLNYTAKKENNYASLQWQTTSEHNNKSFIIYRSGDDKQFVRIGEVDGKGTTSITSNYSFYDKQPLNGNNYYKLMQADNNSKETDLGTRSLSFSLSALSLQLYPNPTKNNLTVTFTTDRYQNLEIVNLNGHILQRLAIGNNESKKEISLSNYAAGTYLIRLQGNEHIDILKVIRE